ncbi:MAG: enoyl-CoA hydratase/isomerase family protein [Promethearchaeota archaeon]
MDLETILFTKEKNIAIIKFNRPKILNAINFRVMEELNQVIDNCAEDNEIRVVIITGEGKAFAAGADLQELQKCGPHEAKDASKRGIDVFRKIELLNKPVIAGINGFALGGGCELAMACDIRIVSEKAKFGQPEIKLGIIPGFGGTQRLTRLIGRGRSKLLNFTGNIITAETAQQYGLVDKLVGHEELMIECIKLGAQISALSPLAMKAAKTAINQGIEMDIDKGMELENQLFADCFNTEDSKEGIQAFLEKRQAKFTGK